MFYETSGSHSAELCYQLLLQQASFKVRPNQSVFMIKYIILETIIFITSDSEQKPRLLISGNPSIAY